MHPLGSVQLPHAMALTMGAVTPARKASDRVSGQCVRTRPSRGDSAIHSGLHFGSASHAPPTVAPHVSPMSMGPMNRTGRLELYLMAGFTPPHQDAASMMTSPPR